MTAKELQQLKERLYGESSRKHNIPLKFFELPPEVIEEYEQQKVQEKIRQAEQQQKVVQSKRTATRGDVSLQRRGRRSVGDFSLDEADNR